MKHKEENEKVKNIGTYIETIKNLTNNISENTVVVYRGENVYYPTYCQPNLFRNNYFKNNKYFERNLLDEMRSNRLTNGNTYLETAVDAQHGGFPSRLLDVTYNSLVALYFAITPSVKKDEDENDGKDGYVYIYYIENLFCPSATNINELFDTIVNREQRWIHDNSIFQRNHKLIDHVKINNRIIAQQGAFILFQGDEVYPIQKSDYKKIVIDGYSKKELRKDLKQLFGIHTGSIYPEVDNLVKEIEIKSNRINNGIFSFSDEIELVINNLNRELNHFKNIVIKESNKFEENNYCSDDVDRIIELTMEIEKTIMYYKEDLKNLKNITQKENSQKLYSIINDYNHTVEMFINHISCYLYKFDIEVNSENLKVNNFDKRG